jgi:hypothetical protein
MEFRFFGVDGDHRSIDKENRDVKVCGLWGGESGRV